MAGKEYEPIDCALHDKLEEYATLSQPVRIEFRGDADDELAVEGRIADVYTKGDAEYVKLEGGDVIRLDRIETVDGRPVARTRARGD